LGIKIISEDEFIAMIGDNDTLPTTTAEVAPTKEVETKEKTSSQNTPQPIQGSLF
jgi:hypothetical protein